MKTDTFHVRSSDDHPTNIPGYRNSGNFLSDRMLIILLLIVISFAAGYYYHMKSGVISGSKVSVDTVPSTQNETNTVFQPTVTQTVITGSQDTSSNTLYSSFTQTIQFTTGNKKYGMKTPPGWSLNQVTENGNTTLTVSNGDNSLIIKQISATEGVPCGFPDAPLTSSDMFPDVSGYTYKTYTQFTGHEERIFRRVDITANPSAGISFFAVCQRRSRDWSQPTDFGFITYEIPYSDYPEKTSGENLRILDAIFGSLRPL